MQRHSPADLVDQAVLPASCLADLPPENRVRGWRRSSPRRRVPDGVRPLSVVEVDGDRPPGADQARRPVEEGPVEGCGWRVTAARSRDPAHGHGRSAGLVDPHRLPGVGRVSAVVVSARGTRSSPKSAGLEQPVRPSSGYLRLRADRRPAPRHDPVCRHGSRSGSRCAGADDCEHATAHRRRPPPSPSSRPGSRRSTPCASSARWPCSPPTAAFWAGAYTELRRTGAASSPDWTSASRSSSCSRASCLSRPWIARARSGPRPAEVGRYFWKRVLRIFPVYLVTAVIALSLIPDNDGLGAGRLAEDTHPDRHLLRRTAARRADPDVEPRDRGGVLRRPPAAHADRLGRRARARRRRIVAARARHVCVQPGLARRRLRRVPGAPDRAVNEWLPAFLDWFAVGIALAAVARAAPRPEPLRAGRPSCRRARAAPASAGSSALGAARWWPARPVAGPTLLVPPTTPRPSRRTCCTPRVGGLLVFTGVFADSASRYGARCRTRRCATSATSRTASSASTCRCCTW